MYRIRVPLAKSEYEKHLAEIALLNLLNCTVSVGGEKSQKVGLKSASSSHRSLNNTVVSAAKVSLGDSHQMWCHVCMRNLTSDFAPDCPGY